MKHYLPRRMAAWSLCAALTLGLCGAAAAESVPMQTIEPILPPVTLPADVRLSPWAEKEVRTAYEAGLIPLGMDLGEDYALPISRADFARLAVELIAVSQEKTADDLLIEQGLKEAAPEEDANAEADEEKKDAAQDETNDEKDTAETEDAENTESTEGEPTEETPEEPAEETPEDLCRFSDTDDIYVELAACLGIVKGSNIGTFNPGGSLKRAEAAVMARRCMELLGRPDANAAPKQFSDAYTIPRWAAESVKYISGRTTAEGKAVMGGTWGKFYPLRTYSTEQAIITLLRCHDSAAVETVREGWQNAPGYDTVEVTVSFGGDCTFGRGRDFAYRNSFDEMYDLKGKDYFFSNLKAFHEDDLSMVNFEGTLTNSTAYREKKFVFKGRAEYAKILEAGSIGVVTVANNHSMDYGSQGFKDTIKNLSPYVAISGYDRLPIVEVKGVKIGFASNTGWAFDAGQKKFINDSIKKLREGGAEIIVFNYHWGIEREYRSNATQRAIAHYCIDQGTDLVIGHHPHVKQEVETYKGKQIAYSLGNLSFGGNRNPAEKNCLIFQQTFSIDLDTRRLAKTSYKALPYKISSVDYRNDYRPTPA